VLGREAEVERLACEVDTVVAYNKKDSVYIPSALFINYPS
jgi:hypothetical protein